MAKSTREKILKSLAQNPGATVNDLAKMVGINAISVRHHLTNLQAEGLVRAEEERHGVGRPRMICFLTEAGLEKFPTRYLQLTNRLLGQMKETLPAPLINELFSQMAKELATTYVHEMKGLSVEERLQVMSELLAKEGFTVEWEKQGDDYHIHEISCPYYKVGQDHPEICTIDQQLISNLLSVPAEKVQCILSGDTFCTYVVRISDKEPDSNE
jgi:predicted ArsR family transcriptional regulator